MTKNIKEVIEDFMNAAENASKAQKVYMDALRHMKKCAEKVELATSNAIVQPNIYIDNCEIDN